MHDTDSIIAAFDRLVARDGSRVIMAAEHHRVSVFDLDNLSRVAGEALSQGRVRPLSAVGFISPNGSGFLAGLVALRRAGHPTALIDSHCTAAEVADTVAALGLSAVLQVRSPWPAQVADFIVTSHRTRSEARSTDGVSAGVDIIKMTSGTGGQPRGVATTSESLLADDAALREAMTIGREDRLVAMVPFAHSYGLSSLVVPALAHGMTLVVPEAAGPLSLIAAATRCEATILPTVPAWLDTWLRLADPPPLSRSIRSVITAGAPLPIQTAQEFRRRFDSGVHVFYGTSETGGITYDRTGQAGERGTVGEPIPGVSVELERAESQASDGSGRVVVESQAVALSYVPESDGSLHGGRFVTQDFARWRGADLEILGRLDRMINVRGRKVDPGEVERVIKKMPGVHSVFVDGPGLSTPVGRFINAVVADGGSGLTHDTVIAWCRAHLAGYKIPTRTVVIPSLPMSPRGKIDRVAIARLLGSQTSSDDQPQ